MIKKAYPLNKLAIQSKMKASFFHFLCSVAVFILALWWMISILYPSFHFELNGGIYGLRIVAMVDLVLGPLITLLVYHYAKPLREKISDFAIIGVIQIAALAYGLHTMYEEHPKMLIVYEYGNAITVTQREWKEAGINAYPQTFEQTTDLGGVPMFAYTTDATTHHATYQAIDLAFLEKASANVQRDFHYAEDKNDFEALQKQHPQLYVLAVMGKYQGTYVALDSQMNLIAEFGRKDLN